MPTIPSLERRTVTPQMRTSGVDVRGVAAVGEGIARGIEEVKSARDRFQLADANSKFAVLKHQQDNAFDEDMDYETIEQRWDENMSKGFQEIADTISDPSLRNFFTMENKPRIEAGRQRMNDLAFAKERDVQRGNINSRLNQLREVGLGDDADSSRAAVQNASDIVNTAVEAGYYSAEEASRVLESWKQDTAEGYVRMQAPEDRLEVLKSPMAEHIPSDKKAQLTREAKDAQLNNKAVDMVDDLGQDFTLEQLYSNSAKIEDKNLRRKYETRGEQVHSDQKRATLEQAEDFHQEAFVPVLLGERDLDVNDPEFRELPTKLQEDLMRANRAKSAPRKKTDPWVQDNMIRLNLEKDYTALRSYFTSNIHKLSAADQAKWSKISLEGTVPEEWQSEFSLDQQIESELSRTEYQYNVDQKRQVRGLVNDWHKQQVESTGKPPSDTDTLAKIRELTSDVDLSPRAWWGDHPYYTLDDEGRTELIEVTLDQPTNVSADQFNIVVRDVLENPNEQKQVTQAVEHALSNPARLNEDNQRAVADLIGSVDPVLSMDLMDQIVNETGRVPSSLEFLEIYERARKLQ